MNRHPHTSFVPVLYEVSGFTADARPDVFRFAPVRPKPPQKRESKRSEQRRFKSDRYTPVWFEFSDFFRHATPFRHSRVSGNPVIGTGKLKHDQYKTAPAFRSHNLGRAVDNCRNYQSKGVKNARDNNRNISDFSRSRNGQKRADEISDGFYAAVRRIFLLSAMLFYAGSCSAEILSFCRRLWTSPPAGLSFENQNPTAGPTVTVLMEALRTADQRGWLNPPVKKEDFKKGAEDMINFLERKAGAREQAVLNGLEIPLKTALNQLPHIMESLKELSDPSSAPYFQETALAVLAVFSKHLPSLLKEGDPYHSGRQKIHPILSAIALFNPEKPYFSLYKIKRSVEQYFSLKEFNHAGYH